MSIDKLSRLLSQELTNQIDKEIAKSMKKYIIGDKIKDILNKIKKHE